MLSSAEIGTLIKALGCGIGTEEFNPDALRYHSIIIMTDADVDGSHIRTLLLTFFFRQMRPLVERGHIYIAQPPLYKIRKGKQEQYLKDDEELALYQTQMALEDASLHVNPDAPGISGTALQTIVQDYRSVQSQIKRLSRQYPLEVLQAMLNLDKLSVEQLAEEAVVSDWVAQLNKAVSSNKNGAIFRFSVKKDEEEQIYVPMVTSIIHGVTRKATLTLEFFKSLEYKD